MNLASLLDAHAAARPNAAAILVGSGKHTRTVTFAELQRHAQQAATLLAQKGIGPGDRVLILQGMSPELYECLLGLFQIGAVAMFLDPGAGPGHLAACCNLAPPAALIASWRAHLLRFRIPALRKIPRKFVIGPPFPGAVPWRTTGLTTSPRVFATTADSPALLTFTSGSTGMPKGALRTHGLLLAQHQAIANALELAPGQVDLATLPIFLLANLASGVTSVIPDADLRGPGAIKAGPVLAQISQHRVTQSVASPAFFERLIEGNPPPLEKIFTGGAPVSPRLIARLRSAFSSARIYPVYGSTEAEPIAHFECDEMSQQDIAAMRGGSGLLVGRPVPEIQVRIMRHRWGKSIGPLTYTQFSSVCLPSPEPGEIVVSGAHVLPGYLNGLGDDETKFRVDGTAWHRTGDSGFIDPQGRLWLLGRSSARIEDSKGILWPFAVEIAAQEIRNIRRAALLQHEGKRVLAVECVTSDPGISQRCQELLAWAKLDEVRQLRAIPLDRRHNAKVDYPALKQRLKRVVGA